MTREGHYSKAAERFLRRKIRKLRREKYEEKQAVAIAFAMARDQGYKVPKKPSSNPGLGPLFRKDHHDHR